VYRQLKKGEDPNSRQQIAKILAKRVGWESILLAATVEHNHANPLVSFLEWVVLQGPKLDASPCRLTPLQAAVQLRNHDAAKLLLENCANANAVGSLSGYSLAGAGLDESLARDSPLRILRTTHRIVTAYDAALGVYSEDKEGDTRKKQLEELLVDVGARDFTITYLPTGREDVSVF
jgi:hypothetical protein